MADAAARREARKKRILENSESRLQRIAGRNAKIPEANSKQECDAPGAEPSTSSSANGSSVSEAFIQKESDCLFQEETNPTPSHPNFDIDKLFHDLSSEDGLLAFQSMLNDLHKNDSNHDMHEIDSTGLRHRAVTSERLSPEKQTTEPVIRAANESNGDINMVNAIPSVSEISLSYTVLSSKWMLVLVAAIVNILYLLQLDHLFGKTILMPFFVVMLGRLLIVQDKREAQGGTMLAAALILCNVRPEVVYRLKWFMRVTTRVTEEFAIYIFSFVIMYNAISSYWNDIETSIGDTDTDNKAEGSRYTGA